jgi:SWI/SNF-related matrix-associated actin-dependent regulator 1 of chromatin subfamily A
VSSSPEERKMFRVLRMQYVVLDEAHMLKNMATVRYDNLARINVSTNVNLCNKFTVFTVYFILVNAWPPQV